VEESQQKICTHKVNVHQSSFAGMAWFGGWLFTIGYLQLGFWKDLLALVIWPYYIGVHSSLLPR
jgi:hypothetical protein